jgi:hypothetical protein
MLERVLVDEAIQVLFQGSGAWQRRFGGGAL